jgi:hypothetical protein
MTATNGMLLGSGAPVSTAGSRSEGPSISTKWRRPFSARLRSASTSLYTLMASFRRRRLTASSTSSCAQHALQSL